MPAQKKRNPFPLLGKLSPVTNDLLKSDIDTLQHHYINHLEFSQAKDRFSATAHDFYRSLAFTVRDRLFERWIETQQTYHYQDVKRIYYISMEFMLGRLLGNAMINMDLRENMHQALWELGLDLEELQEVENDAGLGNGGLGRLAACFLDSMASLELPGFGYGIRYDYGIFSQKIFNGWQVEIPDNWLRFGNPWEIERPEYNYRIRFYGRVQSYQDEHGRTVFDWVDTEDVIAVAYDTPIPGYKNNTVNNLRLWAAKSSEEFNLEYFNHGNYDKAVEDKINSEILSKVLYPRDDFVEGRELRLKQEYFLVSATMQDLLRRFRKGHGKDFNLLPDKVAVQLNDTHPAMAIPELMRLLVDIEELDWDEAWEITRKCFAYTNHTILPEALETWRIDLFEKVLPRILQIIYEINHRFLKVIRSKLPGDMPRVQRLSIVDEQNDRKLRMAQLAIVGSHSVNGVAELHSRLIRERLFRDFYELWPEKFNNKTNGITQRRWLKQANPELSELIDSRIGNGWVTNLPLLKGLEKWADDEEFHADWQKVKTKKKRQLFDFIESRVDLKLDPESLLDCQVKRIHEYKRQLMNVLHVIDLYNRIKSGRHKKMVPRTVLFAGKAAPAYHTAKLIIRLIHGVAERINNDPDTKDLLTVVFIPDYSVSLAERIIPAADLSEQISTAGMEASGTGNMKFALNGALTIGTLDGANIEIGEEAGFENIFIFGLNAEEVQAVRSRGYKPREYADKNTTLKTVLKMIDEGFFTPYQPDLFTPLVQSLLNHDEYLLIADFQSYADMQRKVEKTFLNRKKWTTMSILNTARMGKFSSDRAIREYAREIWNVQPVPVTLFREQQEGNA